MKKKNKTSAKPVVNLYPCTKCKTPKPRTEFWADSSAKIRDGVGYWCKTCFNALKASRNLATEAVRVQDAAKKPKKAIRVVANANQTRQVPQPKMDVWLL